MKLQNIHRLNEPVVCDNDEDPRRSRLLRKSVRHWWRLSPISREDHWSPHASVDRVHCFDLTDLLPWVAVSAQIDQASFPWSVFQRGPVSDDTRSYRARSFHGTCKTFLFGFVSLTTVLEQVFHIELYDAFVETRPPVKYSKEYNCQTWDYYAVGHDFDLVFYFDSRSLSVELVCF